jgi:predicted DNA-binding protein
VQAGASWCKNEFVATKPAGKKIVRRSISLPRELDSKIHKLARRENRSTNQVIENLIESGIETKEAERRRFFALVERLHLTTDRTELQSIKEELARMTFGA